MPLSQIAEDSVPNGMSRTSLLLNCQGHKGVGYDAKHLQVERFPVRRFPEFRQRILSCSWT